MAVFNPEIDRLGEAFNVDGKTHRGYYSDIKGKKLISFQLPEFSLNRGDIIIRARDGAKFRVVFTDPGKNADGVVISFAAEIAPI